VPPDAGTAVSDAADAYLPEAQEQAGDTTFSSNPCEGPSARFLSTCR
jgi:hypothetical protein